MEALMGILPVILYIMAIVLIVILIILGIKLIDTIGRVNVILDDIEKKSKSLNGIFSIIDTVTDSVASVSDSIMTGVSGFVSRIFKKRRKDKKEESEMFDYE